MQVVTLLTDFGTEDTYVAQMKGIICSIAPKCSIIDITHQISPQNVLAGATALRDSAMFFPVGTIHVAVVDPGVGTTRRLIAVGLAGHFFVLPDNGLLSFLLLELPLECAVELTKREFWRANPSHTFHGRDILAPVASHLANGRSLLELGLQIEDVMRLKINAPKLAME